MFLDFVVNHVVVIVALQLKLFKFGLINSSESFETSAPLVHRLVVVAEDNRSLANVGTGCDADQRLACCQGENVPDPPISRERARTA